mmetsp:Transcript_4901/g.7473  ORF Transcript_4901/g.7473 Transcript_4901/m.7473 type:complete len:209 (+) Transcript_4901:89-715(+)|eukprot:CAMPEP_0185017250 /NCGR_PEP_ID=MMETSP1103-20130426/221_1 /TAXON_ID=36769 /ORGANISM="Paraphysomonas bandaiensis, Strain Caron Lab Isolate" /LENGTH=208 /DNA_ID=CAMNT_0027546561 /DNA_START=87 /DNA_END=713 /DNA_ORIENTATION=+
MGDRKSPHHGATAWNTANNLVVYDAEIRDLDCCMKAAVFLCAGFSFYDRERSYLYVRQNSIESNFTLSPCCGVCLPIDNTGVRYFDRAPFKTFGCCPTRDSDGICVPTDQPKFEITDLGCLICFSQCCSDKRAVVMPFENFPFPCCCCRNRVSACDNCFGCCGPITGNPKFYISFMPQPEDPEAFVQAAQQAMGTTAPASGMAATGSK